MTRESALKLLHDNMKNQNLRRHCYAVEGVMRALYRRLEDHRQTQVEEDIWGIAGLLHDADYELTKETARTEHTKHILEWLKKADAETDIYDAIAAHAWGYVSFAPEPKTKMQWALFTCDELTGLVVAVALVKPDKNLAAVTVDSVMKKWNSASFAAGVNRKQIEECDPRLGIPLREFVDIALSAMQGIHDELGL
ncbi:MAG: Metal dependent phosphohydrolase [Candidatus Woesebacteria bacterium GW2011_GWB1_38_8]|uniref:Metal dependent phosphohydrolase n=1 Tax=Candidatus Woesebacteria bacterium GW2011_GWB1_38_8 TaxID=1618570 RepID=A0A0G0L9H4_9BACT|nr:MAG: Metal dependent phosphohydrolase [Candidatus Woesebacteria bacterium GW2011_GWB1_38_8]